MTAPIVIHGNAFVSRYKVKPECRDEFIRIFNSLWQGHEAEMQAVTNFVFYGWGRDPNEFVALESWKSEEITNAVRATEDFKKNVSALLELCTEHMVMELYSPWEGGDRSVFDLYAEGASKVHPVCKTGIGAVFR